MKTLLTLSLPEFVACAADTSLDLMDNVVVYQGAYIDEASLQGADPTYAYSSLVAHFETRDYIFQYRSEVFSIEKGLDPAFKAELEQLWTLKPQRRLVAVEELTTWEKVFKEQVRELKR